MKKLASLLILFLTLSCAKNDKKVNKISREIKTLGTPKFDFQNKSLQTNLNKAILDGDTLAYIRSYKSYTTNGKSREFLYYALLMAEKNNYRRAYYDISRILALRTDDPLVTKYNYSSKFGNYSFLKSYELGDDFAKDDVKDFYINQNKPIPKSTSIYCSK